MPAGIASGEALAGIGCKLSRLSTKHEWRPTTTTAAHARAEREFALVKAGCEACAPCDISEAIET